MEIINSNHLYIILIIAYLISNSNKVMYIGEGIYYNIILLFIIKQNKRCGTQMYVKNKFFLNKLCTM